MRIFKFGRNAWTVVNSCKMGIEIERKFLVKQELLEVLQASALKKEEILQGYLSVDPARSVRVRSKGTKAFLTIKGRSEGISRLELEYEIPLAEARQLLALSVSAVIEKTRYFLPVEGKTWEVDVFEGLNEGLLLAELELSNVDEKFEVPDWVIQEVSEDVRYYNAYLSQHPYSTWDEQLQKNETIEDIL